MVLSGAGSRMAHKELYRDLVEVTALGPGTAGFHDGFEWICACDPQPRINGGSGGGSGGGARWCKGGLRPITTNSMAV